MDIINYAIREIMFTIPREVLRMVYMPKENWRRPPTNLEEQIRAITINARVLPACDIVGGDTIYVEIGDLPAIHLDLFNYIYEIPPERLNNRTILTVKNMKYMAMTSLSNSYLPGTSPNTPNYVNDVSSAAARAMDSRSNIPIVSNAEAIVVGHNTVMVKNHLITAAVQQMEVIVTNDANLSNISVRSALDFAKLCKYAVESYIYKELRIQGSRGFIEHGVEIDAIKSYVDTLSDSEENFQTFLREVWAGVSTMNDRVTYDDLLRIQCSPAL